MTLFKQFTQIYFVKDEELQNKGIIVEIVAVGEAEDCDFKIPDLNRDGGTRMFHSLVYVPSKITGPKILVKETEKI